MYFDVELLLYENILYCKIITCTILILLLPYCYLINWGLTADAWVSGPDVDDSPLSMRVMKYLISIHSPTLIYRKNIFECCSTVKKKHQILKRSCTSSWPLAQNSPYNNLSAEHNPIVRVEKRHSTSGLRSLRTFCGLICAIRIHIVFIL